MLNSVVMPPQVGSWGGERGCRVAVEVLGIGETESRSRRTPFIRVPLHEVDKVETKHHGWIVEMLHAVQVGGLTCHARKRAYYLIRLYNITDVR